jgi:hypothetical protein
VLRRYGVAPPTGGGQTASVPPAPAVGCHLPRRDAARLPRRAGGFLAIRSPLGAAPYWSRCFCFEHSAGATRPHCATTMIVSPLPVLDAVSAARTFDLLAFTKRQ